MKQVSKFKAPSITVQIVLALGAGVLLGLFLQGNPETADLYIKPFGTIFLNLVKMVVVPVVLFSIISGIISLKDIRKVGAIGGRTILFYVCTTAFAVTLGLLAANILSVGNGFTLQTSSLETYQAAAEAPTFMETLVNIFPSNIAGAMVNASMLQIIVIAIFFGFGIILAGEKGKSAAAFMESMSEVCIKVMGIIIQLSPIGVFALITPVVASNGPDVLMPLLKLIGVVYFASVLHMFLVYATSIKLFAKMSPIRFFKGMSSAILFAFSSASSVGTLPLSMECTEKLGADPDIAAFVLPLGATINMDGTAIYQGVCAVFIAQIFGIDLSIGAQITIILTATLASIGTAGVPGSGVIMLAMVLESVGLPLEGIALVAGVDRILDMARTTVNITGDAACTMIINRYAGKNLMNDAIPDASRVLS